MFDLTPTHLTTIYIIVGNLFLSAVILWMMRRGKASIKNVTLTGVTLLVWQAFLILKLTNESLFVDNISKISFGVALFGFVGLLCLVLAFIKPIRDVFLNLSYENLLLPQGLRMFFGAGFLIEGVLGIMPKGFSIADGIFHITSAFLALSFGVLYAQKRGSRKGLWFANVFGLSDIVVVAFGIPYALIEQVGPNHNMMYAAFFAAPIFVAFHFFSIWKLVLNHNAEKTTVGFNVEGQFA